jgi:hypothetical protein
MHKFRLVQRTNTKFQVLCGEDVVGSICVEPNQVADLLKCWSGERQPQSQKPNPMVAAMMKLKPRAMSRAALLRGCL